jgi:hypothetical protein
MRVGRIVAVMVGVGIAIGAWPGPARATQIMSREQQIVVRGVVPERRVIVVDARQKIVQITSNTSHDVAPEVMLMAFNGPRVPLTDDVQQQYEAVMRQVGDDKAATIRPVPAPAAELFPEFASPMKPAEYEVTPERVDKGKVTPYRVRVP